MGQYYLVVNLDKKQFIHPHALGDGMKLMEFGLSAFGTMTALAILLADGNGRGSGDLHSESPIIGSWVNNRIVIAGDYADEGKFVRSKKKNLYDVTHNQFENISEQVLEVMLGDEHIRKTIFSGRMWGSQEEALKNILNRHREWISEFAKCQENVDGSNKSLHPDMVITMHREN